VDGFERQVQEGELEEPHGSIRIATQCHTAYHWLPAVMKGFVDRWPSVKLRVAVEHTPAPLTALREGSLDLALIYTRGNDRRIRYERLFDDEMVLITSPDHRLGTLGHTPVDALADEHLYVYSSLARHSVVMHDILEAAGVQPRQITRLQLTEAIIELVAAGMGVAILAKWAVAPAVQSGAVRMVRLGKEGHSRTWYAAMRSSEVIAAYHFDLIELFRRHLAVGPSFLSTHRHAS
jgi:LysR family transcriptional regulator for metE and metH